MKSKSSQSIGTGLAREARPPRKVGRRLIDTVLKDRCRVLSELTILVAEDDDDSRFNDANPAGRMKAYV